MKKLLVALLAILLLASLCACGETETGGEEVNITVKPKTESTEDTTLPEDTTGGAEETTVDSTAEDTTVPVQSDKRELAVSCIGKNVSELYALIGQPNSSVYSPSCLVEGDDGELYYDGFTVYTTREGDVETVYDVE